MLDDVISVMLLTDALKVSVDPIRRVINHHCFVGGINCLHHNGIMLYLVHRLLHHLEENGRSHQAVLCYKNKNTIVDI